MSTFDDERAFGEILVRTRALARKQGGALSRAQVEEAFAALRLSEAQLRQVYAYFREQGMRVEEALPEPDAPSGSREAAFGGEAAARAWERACEGEGSSRDELIALYLPLVDDIARMYAGQGVLREDLIGEGNLALMTGMKHLREYADAAAFEEALSGGIMEAMELLVHDTVRLRTDDEKALSRVQELADKAKKLSGEYRRALTVAELQAEIGWDTEEIVDLLRLTGFRMEGVE